MGEWKRGGEEEAEVPEDAEDAKEAKEAKEAEETEEVFFGLLLFFYIGDGTIAIAWFFCVFGLTAVTVEIKIGQSFFMLVSSSTL